MALFVDFNESLSLRTPFPRGPQFRLHGVSTKPGSPRHRFDRAALGEKPLTIYLRERLRFRIRVQLEHNQTSVFAYFRLLSANFAEAAMVPWTKRFN